MTRQFEAPELLTPAEVAKLWGVGPKTINRWARDGKLGTPVRTMGGHRRYRANEIRLLLRRQAGGS